MISDSQIIKGCIEGNIHYQELLYKKYAPVMLGICCRYFKNREQAEDVLQEGFIKVFLNLEKFERRGSFEGWIKKIIINTAINIYKSNLKHSFHIDIDEIEEFYIDINYLYDDFAKEDLLKIIRELPDGYRVIFNLFAIEGFKHKEIAKELNITEGTSKSQLSRARKLLIKKLDELNNEK